MLFIDALLKSSRRTPERIVGIRLTTGGLLTGYIVDANINYVRLRAEQDYEGRPVFYTIDSDHIVYVMSQ